MPPDHLQTVVALEQGRLKYYRSAASPDYWDSVWDSVINENFYTPYKQGRMGMLEPIFQKWLTKDGPILEAGCGLAQYVVALRSLGYDCHGVDYAERVVNRVQTLFPTLPVTTGDISQLNFPDKHFKQIISLGVVEHLESGPKPLIGGMKRALADDGTLLISVPYLNFLRRFKYTYLACRKSTTNLDFYQWAFTPREFKQILSDQGFTTLFEYGLNHYKCLIDDVLILSTLPVFARNIITKGTGMIPGLAGRLGHMRLYVAKKSLD
jgi:SAM-dependent methyltransferase